MATPAQAAAATVGAGSLAAAGAYGITQAVNGGGEEANEEQETSSVDDQNEEIVRPDSVETFTNNESFTSTDYENKLISFIKQDNLPHIVKVKGNNAKKWWKWAYENKYKKSTDTDQFDQLFQGLDKGYSEKEDSKALNQACDAAYKKTKAEYSFSTTSYLLKNISDFCTKEIESFDISEPKHDAYLDSYSATNGYEHGVLSVPSNKVLLVKKTKDNNNELWWNWVFRKFYVLSQNSNSEVFKDQTQGYSEDTESGVKSLNKACDTAYQKQYTDLNNNSKDLLLKIKKFCSWDRTDSELILPEPSTKDLLSSDGTADNTYNTPFAKNAENKGKLIDPKKSENWWTWSFSTRFSKYEKTKLPTPFNQVTQAFKEPVDSETANNFLNQACADAYKKQKEALNKVETNDSKKLVDYVKEFCAIGSMTGDLTVPN